MTRRSESDCIHFIVPGALDQATGGYIYDRRMVDGLRALGRQVVVHELDGRFPDPDAAARSAAGDALARVGAAQAVIDGLALLACDLSKTSEAQKRCVALIHHPLADESGLDVGRRRRFARDEPVLWRRLAGVIVTSEATRREIIAAGVPAGRVVAVTPGVPPAPRAPKRKKGTVRLVAVGTVIPRKGHLALLAALAGLKRQAWRLDCVGSTTRDRRHAARLAAAIRLHRLCARVRLVGERDTQQVIAAYRRAHLFTLPSRHEGFGIAFAEALAHGLPIVAARAGALVDLVPRTAGILSRPGDVGGLRRSLRALLDYPRRRQILRRGALATARRFADWPRQVRVFAAAIDRLMP